MAPPPFAKASSGSQPTDARPPVAPEPNAVALTDAARPLSDSSRGPALERDDGAGPDGSYGTHGGAAIVPRVDSPLCGACGSPARVPYYAPGDIVECLGCGVLYVSPRPSDAAMARFYSFYGRYAHRERKTGQLPTFSTWLQRGRGAWRPTGRASWRPTGRPVVRRRLARVRRHVREGRLLDIGAEQGDFAALARSVFEAEGTEISREGVRVARDKHGLDLHLGDPLALHLLDGHYDVITLWHQLVRVTQPQALVARCFELLRPGGVLAISVPNTDAGAQLTRARFEDALRFAVKGLGLRIHTPRTRVPIGRLELQSPLEDIRLTHFTLETLEGLLEREGFEVVESGLDDLESGSWIGHHLESLFYRLTRIALGPAIYLAARKRG